MVVEFVWNVTSCAVFVPSAHEVVAQTSRFCRTGHGLEVTCTRNEHLLDAVGMFQSKVGQHFDEALDVCWPVVLASVLVHVLFEQSSVRGLDQMLDAGVDSPTRPLNVGLAGSDLAQQFAQAEHRGFVNPQGLNLGLDGFDLRPAGLPFFSTGRSIRKLVHFHRQFASVHLHSCSQHRAQNVARLRGTFSLKANISTEDVPCSTAASEEGLVRRCLHRQSLVHVAAENRTPPALLRCPRPLTTLVDELEGDAAFGAIVEVEWDMVVAPWIGRENLTFGLADLPRFVLHYTNLSLPSKLLLRLPWVSSGHRGHISFRCAQRTNVVVALRCVEAHCDGRKQIRVLGLEPVVGTDAFHFRLSDGEHVSIGRKGVQPGQKFSLPKGLGQAILLILPDDLDFHWTQQKWKTRFAQGWCEPGYGRESHYGWLTSTYFRAVQKCSFIVSLDWINPPPGGWLLDWGCACGHKLVWAKQLYGLRVVGVDYQLESINWARWHAPALELVCHADGRNLSWLPDGFFDAALAFGAIYALGLMEQCSTVIQIIRKLRRGSRAVIGYNSPSMNILDESLRYRTPVSMVPPYESWQECFEGRGPWKEVGGLPPDVSVRHDIMWESSWYLGYATATALSTSILDLESYALLVTRL